jgi:pyrroline-5-carboxylate reductase
MEEIMNTPLGFIGGGRIVRIITGGLARAGYGLQGSSFSENSDEAASALLSERPELRRVSQENVAAASDILFIALPPPAIADALGGGKLKPKPGSIVVSLAPKPSLAKLRTLLGYDRVARVIPNAPSLLGKGYNPVSFSNSLSESERSRIADLLDALGGHPEVPDDRIEAYAIVSAMGPTYFFFQVYELMRIARESGLGDRDAAGAAKAMLEGMVAEEAIAAMYAAALPAALAKLKA